MCNNCQCESLHQSSNDIKGQQQATARSSAISKNQIHIARQKQLEMINVNQFKQEN